MTGPKITSSNKNERTHIVYILDRSGSMLSIKAATIEAFNEFISGQKSVEGEVTFTLVQFDDKYEVVFDGIPLEEVPPLNDTTFKPRGMTALLDAQGRTINSTLQGIKLMPAHQRPTKVICVTQTDGHENSSKEFSEFHIKKMVETAENEYKWEMIFLGASNDAMRVAVDYGYAIGKSLKWSADELGAKGAMASAGAYVTRARTAAPGEALGFTDLERTVAEGKIEVNVEDTTLNANQ